MATRDASSTKPLERAAARRVVLVGASNLTKGIGTVLDASLAMWGGPLEVLAACGHGRSFGLETRVLVRQLPGILQCGLWDRLAAGPELPTVALVTDIGNDLLYEQPVERIAGWVEACFDRLIAARARTVVTLLPIDNLPSISRARFHFFRALFVPSSRIGLEEIVARAEALDRRVQQLATERGIATVRQRTAWYSIDPIHIHFLARRRAWREILGSWSEGGFAAAPRGGGLSRTLYLRTRRPQVRRMFGIEQRAVQPVARLSDGTTVSIY